MKAIIIFFSCILTFNLFAQQEYLLKNDPAFVEELNKEAFNPQHSPEERKLLSKISNKIVNFSKVMAKNKTTRKIGKGASFIATNTARPFVNSSAFLTALFEKKQNSEIPLENIYQFFLIHEPEFRELTKNSGTLEELIEKIYEKLDEILIVKEELIFDDIIELTEGDLEKLKPSMINDHPEFQDLKLIVGNLTEEDIELIIEEGELDLLSTFKEFEDINKIKIHEIVTTILGQTLLSTKVIGIVSGVLAKVYGVTIVAADIVAGLSAVACVANDDVIAKIETDQDIKNFCSYVAVQSVYTLSRSRARGYVAGKRFRVKTHNFIEKMGLKKKKSN
jgi:hypothetical protein